MNDEDQNRMHKRADRWLITLIVLGLLFLTVFLGIAAYNRFASSPLP